MHTKRFVLALWTALVLLLACSGGGGGGGQPAATNTPTNLKVTQGDSFDKIQFDWTAPSDPGDGYEFEGKMGAGAFEKLHAGLMSPTWTSAYTFLNSSIPELTDFTFRIRTVKASVGSPYSNEASYRRTLKPVGSVFASFNNSAVSVNWYTQSTIAEGFRLERAEVSSSGAVGAYTAKGSFPLSVLQYSDLDLQEGKTYKYRVFATKGSEESIRTESYSVSVPLLGPTNLSVESRIESLRLTWTNRSAMATALKVMRSPGVDSTSFSTVATLSPTATDYLDAPLASGYYTYRVDAVSVSNTVGSSPVNGATLPTGSGLSFLPKILNLPSGPALAMDGQGNWFAAQDKFQAFAIKVRQGRNLGIPCPGPGRRFRNAGPAVGSRRPSPHDLHSADHPGLPGAGHRPRMARRRPLEIRGSGAAGVNFSTGNSGIQWAISPLGNLHLAWQLDYTSTSVEYATNAGGTWSISPAVVTANPMSTFGFVRITVAQDGTPILAMAFWDKLYLLSRPAGMAWREELVPTGTLNGGWYGALSMVAQSADVLSVFYERSASNPSYSVMHLAKTASGWGVPESVATSGSSASYTRMKAAGNTDGTRMFITLSLSGVQLVVSRDPTLGWRTTSLGPSGYSEVFPGFTSSGKAYVLVPVGNSDYSTSTQFFGFFSEQP